MFACMIFFCLCFGFSLAQSDSPPAIVVHPPTYSTATTSQTVRMTCAAYGVPKPSITWSRASGDLASKLSQSNSGFTQYDKTVTVNDTDFLVSVLEICGVNTWDTDEYTCMGTNGVSGIGISPSDASFFLSVSGATPEPPAVIVRPPSDVTTIDYGSTIEAVCVAYGNPIPSVMWKKDGCTDLSCGGQSGSKMYNEMVTYGQITFRKSIMQICNVSEWHSGMYTCQAMNGVEGIGVAPSDSSWQLSVKPKPVSTSVSIPPPPTTTCPSYTIPAVPSTSARAIPSAEPTTGRQTDDGSTNTAYLAVIIILGVIIAILLISLIVVIVIALKLRGSPRQKADIAIPPKDPRVYSVENPIHKDGEENLEQDDEKDADTMTYADLAKKMADEADD